jgi:hypothetical protein
MHDAIEMLRRGGLMDLLCACICMCMCSCASNDRSFRFSSVFAFLISLVVDGCHVLRRKENREGIEKKVTCPSFSVLSSEGVARVLHGERLTFPKAHLRLPTALGLAPLFSCVCVCFVAPVACPFFSLLTKKERREGEGQWRATHTTHARTITFTCLPLPFPLFSFPRRRSVTIMRIRKVCSAFFLFFCFILIY